MPGPVPRRAEHIDPARRFSPPKLKPVRAGPFNPTAKLVPGNSVVRMPSSGPLRGLTPASLTKLQALGGPTFKAMAVPKLSDVARTLMGGRPGVPRHVAPVPAPALNSITPNMVNQSDAGQTVRGVLRRRLATSKSPRRTGGPARTM